jgi:hypothetical protein
MLKPLLILTYVCTYHILFLIFPCAYAVTVHFPILPVAFVPVEFAFADTMASDRVLQEIALVVSVVGVGKAALAVLVAVLELSGVD